MHTLGRPLRSVLIGDCDYYPSEFIFGVHQGMTLLGHWHSTVNIRQPFEVIKKRVDEVQPDIVWGHMLLWSPAGLEATQALLALCAQWRRRGARVLVHDGDARAETRFPHSLTDSVDGVLCNHTQPRTPWGVPQLRWPYFAFCQPRRAAPVDDYRCDLVFAGRLSGEGIYRDRTLFIHALKQLLGTGMRLFPLEGSFTLFRTPELAASAGAVLGYARPESPGWLDVRCFQYPGAGGVLLYDENLQGFLEPWVHYMPYTRHSVDSVLFALGQAQQIGDGIREAAFEHVQAHHSSVARVREALKFVGIEP